MIPGIVVPVAVALSQLRRDGVASMLYPVPVLVPTVYGRTNALLYEAPSAGTGVALIEPLAGGSHVERIFDEVALYLRAAGSSVLRLATPGRMSSTESVANVLGCVAFLRSLGAQEVVLIAHAAQEPRLAYGRLSYGRLSYGAAGSDAADIAYAGFLDLIASSATTPERYAQLVSDLVDTIRAVIDSVVGIAWLLPSGGTSAAGGRQLLSRVSEPSVSGRLPRHEQIDSCPVCFLDTPPGGADALDCIAPLYTWALSRLGLRRGSVVRDMDRTGSSTTPSPTTAASGAWIERGRGQLSEVIWGQLEPAWHDVLAGLAARSPAGARQVKALERQRPSAPSRAMTYGCAWTYLDRQARAEWLDACAQIFPLRQLDSPAG